VVLVFIAALIFAATTKIYLTPDTEFTDLAIFKSPNPQESAKFRQPHNPAE
jgi:hypothetical protein